MKYAFVVLCLAGSALANLAFDTSCPVYKTMDNFNITKFGGRWYEAIRLYRLDPPCGSVSYHIRENGRIMVVKKVELPGKDSGTTFTRRISGGGCMSGSDDTLIFNYHVSRPAFDHHVQVLKTDYDTFAVVYECLNFGHIRLVYPQIYTRDQGHSVDVITNGIKVFESNGINETDFIKNIQNQC